MNWKKYAIGLALFGLYLVIWNQIGKRVPVVGSLIN
jgi:hypothetical protein